MAIPTLRELILFDAESVLFGADGFSAAASYNGNPVSVLFRYDDAVGQRENLSRGAMGQASVLARDVPNPAYKDEIVIDGKTWRVDRVLAGDGHTWKLEISTGVIGTVKAERRP